MGLARGEPTEHVRNRNPHVADARTPATLARLDGNDVLVVHGRKSSIIPSFVQQRFKRAARRDPEKDIGFPLSLNGIGEGYDKLSSARLFALSLFATTMLIFKHRRPG
jgi:hypothetical protein